MSAVSLSAHCVAWFAVTFMKSRISKDVSIYNIHIFSRVVFQDISPMEGSFTSRFAHVC